MGVVGGGVLRGLGLQLFAHQCRDMLYFYSWSVFAVYQLSISPICTQLILIQGRN